MGHFSSEIVCSHEAHSSWERRGERGWGGSDRGDLASEEHSDGGYAEAWDVRHTYTTQKSDMGVMTRDSGVGTDGGASGRVRVSQESFRVGSSACHPLYGMQVVREA